MTRVGFELAPSGYWSPSIPVELSNPQGLEASFVSNLSARDILTTNLRLSMRGCALFQFYFRF